MSDIKEDFAQVLKQCEEYKDNVEAYIILAVTNKRSDDEKSAVGINAISGTREKLCNLILNIDKDLTRDAFASYIVNKFAKGLFKDD